MLAVTIGNQPEAVFYCGEKIPQRMGLNATNMDSSKVVVFAEGKEFYQAITILNNGVLVPKDRTIFCSMVFVGDEARKIILNWY